MILSVTLVGLGEVSFARAYCYGTAFAVTGQSTVPADSIPAFDDAGAAKLADDQAFRQCGGDADDVATNFAQKQSVFTYRHDYADVDGMPSAISSATAHYRCCFQW